MQMLRIYRIKSSTNKKTTYAITLILLALMLIASVPLAVVHAQVHGQAPTQNGYIGPTTVPAGVSVNYTIQDQAFLSVSPNPIGVGQTLLVNVWITFPSGEGKFMNGYVVTIIKPDGTKETVNLQSYVADGTSWFTYVPSQVGTWQFQFSFPGEYFPPGYYSAGNYSATYISGWIYNPSDYCAPAISPVTNLTVQQEMVLSWPLTLPTDYWSHPIEPNNRWWYNVAGNYPSPFTNTGATQATNSWSDEWYGPFVPAVQTPHILWSKVAALAGIIGGDTGQSAAVVGPSSAYCANTPSVIYMGRCYATVTKSIAGQMPQSYAECYDLQTGQIYYDNPITASPTGGITPTLIAYWTPTGGASSAESVDLLTISSNRLYKINPNTGAVTANISLPSFGTNGVVNYFYKNGYFLSFQYNSSVTSNYDGVPVTLGFNGFIINWTEQGTSTNFASRILSNVSFYQPESFRTLYEPNLGYGYGAYDSDTGIIIIQGRFIYGGFYGGIFTAESLVTGKLLWNITTDVNQMLDPYRPTNAWCRDGIYSYELELGMIQARSEYDGHILWTTNTETQNPQESYPWGEFWMYDEAAYNNLIYAVGYAGVYALDENTGKIVWHYSDPAPPFETPYTNIENGSYVNEYSVQDIRVMGSGGPDGIVYVSNNEHSPTMPPERGWGLIALNATTGQFLWKIWGTRMQVAAGSDGYFVAGSNYDGTLYVVGKGQTKTTVTAPDISVTVGTTVLIQGTVTDLSPAQAGTPCVSEDSMATWMDYLHLQMPVDGFYHNVTITGVPVLLLATDSSGHTTTIGTTTSDLNGFGMEWTPPSSGLWKIGAAFAGDSSYGSSFAGTDLSVSPAPVVTPTPSPAPTASPIAINAVTPGEVMIDVLLGVIAIIIAIAIVGVLLLRKGKQQ